MKKPASRILTGGLAAGMLALTAGCISSSGDSDSAELKVADWFPPGHPVNENIKDWIAESRMEIEMARLLTLKAAHLMDTVGNKQARMEIAAIKVVAPNVALKVIDRAIQIDGGGGVSDDSPLAEMWAQVRTIRMADGPDEVHKMTIARQELRRIDPEWGRKK